MSRFSHHSYLRIFSSVCAIFVLLASVFIVIQSNQVRASNVSITTPVILLHGYDPLNVGDDCSTYWPQTTLLKKVDSHIITLGYYKKDKHCNGWLFQQYKHCLNNDGTTLAEVGTLDESIRHLACEFAWYLNDYYHKQDVFIVTHSMGGLIARYAIYAVARQLPQFPKTLYASKVIDLDTPNGGTLLRVSFNPIQVQEMQKGSVFLQELNSKPGQNPQGSKGTHWTLIATDTSNSMYITCGTGFFAFPPSSSLYMNGGDKIVYEQPEYCHGGNNSMPNDGSSQLDALVRSCSNCPESAISSWNTWGETAHFPHVWMEVEDILFASSTPTPTPTFSPTIIATPPTAKWSIISSPDPSGWSNLNATAADSANDGWAVGTNNWQPLVEHWNGIQWSIFASPPAPSGSQSSLSAVSALSATDVWVLGYYQTYNPNTYNSLIAHWNGTQWAEFPSQSLGNPNAIKAISPNNVWAAGNYYDGNKGLTSTIIDHWDGSQWTIVPSPNGGTVMGSTNHLNAINAISATDIWAVGDYQVGGSSSNPNYTLIEHYDGTMWSIIPSPNIGVGGIELSGVTSTSSQDAWAVGYYNNTLGAGAFIDHWDGVNWSISYSTSDGSMFNGVAASSAHDVWAVGPGPNGANGSAAVAHWNGTQWSTPSTDPISPTSVVANSTNSVWMVGNIWPTPLIEVYG